MDPLGRSICILGPRDAGKTTYLAALAYWHENPTTQKLFNIKPVSPDAKSLASDAKRILLNGESLESTNVKTPIHRMPEYFFVLEIERRRKLLSQIPSISKQQFASSNQEIEAVQLFVRDFGGEMFSEIGRRRGGYSSSFTPEVPDELYQAFVKDCLKPEVQGCLVLLPDWEPGADAKYSRILDQWINLLEQYGRTQDYRLAVAISKCERGELWTGRLDPELDLFRRHLPSTRKILLNSNRVPRSNIDFFAISTFGVLDLQDPRPNRRIELGTNDARAVLRENKKWRPYGLFEPLYWLSTGKRMVLE